MSDLEKRIAKLEKITAAIVVWITFWETVQTPFSQIKKYIKKK